MIKLVLSKQIKNILIDKLNNLGPKRIPIYSNDNSDGDYSLADGGGDYTLDYTLDYGTDYADQSNYVQDYSGLLIMSVCYDNNRPASVA